MVKKGWDRCGSRMWELAERAGERGAVSAEQVGMTAHMRGDKGGPSSMRNPKSACGRVGKLSSSTILLSDHSLGLRDGLRGRLSVGEQAQLA